MREVCVPVTVSQLLFASPDNILNVHTAYLTLMYTMQGYLPGLTYESLLVSTHGAGKWNQRNRFITKQQRLWLKIKGK